MKEQLESLGEYRKHLEQAAELLRRCERPGPVSTFDLQLIHRDMCAWATRDKLLRADPPAATETHCPRCDGRTITGPWSCPECGARYSLTEPKGAPPDRRAQFFELAERVGQHAVSLLAGSPKGVPPCPDCNQTGRHMCEGRRQVVEPPSEPKGAPPCPGCIAGAERGKSHSIVCRHYCESVMYWGPDVTKGAPQKPEGE